MDTDVWSPAPSPCPFPPTNLPPKSPPLHSHHTSHDHVTNTLPNIAFICFVFHYCKGIISYSNCSFHLTPPSREWDPFGDNPISCPSYLCGNLGDWTEFQYSIQTLVGYWRVFVSVWAMASSAPRPSKRVSTWNWDCHLQWHGLILPPILHMNAPVRTNEPSRINAKN